MEGVAADSSPRPKPSACCQPRSWPLWGLAFPPLLVGVPEAVTPDHWFMVGQLGLVAMFDRYELILFGTLLSEIQRDLDIPDESLGFLAALIKFGAFPAFILGVLADKYGRRKVLGVTVLGYTIGSGLTAFSTNITYFVIVQCLARFFAEAELMVGYVMICETFTPNIRGWGVGAVNTMCSMGHTPALVGVALMDKLPYGWRSLYLFGVAPLLYASWLRRTLKEPPMYLKHAAQLEDERIWSRRSITLIASTPMLDAFRMYPKRLTAALLIEAAFCFTVPSTFFETAYYLTEAGFSPAVYGSSAILVGGAALFGGPLSGVLCDRFGRRIVGMLAMLLSAFAHACQYWTTNHVVLLSILCCKTLINVAFYVAKDSLLTESFPTSYRTTSASLRTATRTIFSFLFLVLEGLIFRRFGSNYNASSFMALIAMLGAPLFLLMPETARRDLDDVSPELRSPAKVLGRRVGKRSAAGGASYVHNTAGKPYTEDEGQPMVGMPAHTRPGGDGDGDGDVLSHTPVGAPPPNPPRSPVAERLGRVRRGLAAFLRPRSMH